MSLQSLLLELLDKCLVVLLEVREYYVTMYRYVHNVEDNIFRVMLYSHLLEYFSCGVIS